MTESSQWKPKLRDYKDELSHRLIAPLPCTSHPLDGNQHIANLSTSVSINREDREDPLSSRGGQFLDTISVVFDPLGASQSMDNPFISSASLSSDPLISALTESTRKEQKGEVFQELPTEKEFEPWSAKRTYILGKYTTSERLSITTSFLSEEEKEKLEVKAKVAASSDRTKTRLEQLDLTEEGSVREMLNLSQNEYVKKIDEMHKGLIRAWDQEQRVKCLKIAIQCSKLLGDVSVIQFYPSKFVLITDILQSFGDLVFQRIYKKCLQDSGIKIDIPPDQFDFSMVTESARETCRNWFYKIASIRELIPRYYTEVAILKCYSFLTKSEYSQALSRLANTTKGIGHPLVSLYARCYITRLGMEIAPDIKVYLLPLFCNFLQSIPQFSTPPVTKTLNKQNLDQNQFASLFVPGVEWILQCLAFKANENVFDEIIEAIKESTNNSLVLNALMSMFPPIFISARAALFVDLIRGTSELGLPRSQLYRSLGVSVLLSDPPQEHRKELLNSVWKQMTKLDNPRSYIECAEIWCEYAAKHFGKNVINKIAGDVIKHMSDNRAFEQHYTQLSSIMTKILTHIHDFNVLFSLDNFLPFLDMFQKEQVKVEVCRGILESFVKHQTVTTHDPVILNSMIFVSKTIHDSLNALSPDDEKRQIATLIKQFVSVVDFGKDFEQQLGFYVEARASFTNLDPVLRRLIQAVNTLAMRTLVRIKGKHTNKTVGFVHACVAYCFITIPSLSSVTTRLELYLLSSQVAYQNGCVSQGDDLLEAAVQILADIPEKMEVEQKTISSDGYLNNYVSNFLSTLLLVPDNPSKTTLYVFRQLLNIVAELKWSVKLNGRMTVYLQALNLLNAYAQSQYLYSIPKIESNQTLYGGDKRFIAEIAKLADIVINEVNEFISQETDEVEKWRASLILLNHLIITTDLHTSSTVKELASNLWIYCKARSSNDEKLFQKTSNFVRFCKEKSSNPLPDDLFT
ncbi:hypothetical protein LOD99_14081 [Oopsacas minuta]|uniref:VPS35 endosomal protein sorting factor-like n=1 Tax=Oopsacas minuta TaxID=111878 RepID=A0AAV7KGN0_9METZ|nr:hypothetical protein LOD99_14081 [Oopsacas minuta]